jgi:hypothetical protein
MKSEVARILSQIQAEYEAASRGLERLALGSACHTFITARMEKMSDLHTELQVLIGDDAIRLISQALDSPDSINRSST